MSTVSDAIPSVEPATARRGSRLRLSRDGLSTVLFLLPLLAVFGLFVWFPILRAVVMSVQETNLVSAPTWVGIDNFAHVLADPQSWRWSSASRCRSSWPS